ncbi:MAG: HlyD family efflux transporter periplasmic adaptor subunit [Clostridiaceae bacterium]|nr:HlyD family efflux transporter periplasmic adaptor subunit [Clostridiaceae bacterium]
MKKLLIVMLCTALMFSAGCNSKETQANTPASEAPVQKNTIDTFGVIKSNEMTNVLIDFPAIIENIHVKEGQKVKKGDVLFTIDYTQFMSEIEQKTIELNTLRQEHQTNSMELEKLKKDLAELQNHLENNSYPDLKRLIADLKSAEKIYSDSLEEQKSKQHLLQKDSLSQAELDAFNKTVDTYQKNVSDTKLSIEKTRYDLQKEIDRLKLQVAQKSETTGNNNMSGIYTQKIDALEKEIKLMKEKINKSYIKQNDIVSDMENAIVYDLTYVNGEALSPDRKLFSLLDADSIIVEANVPEEFIKDIQSGAAATIIPQADKSKIYQGKITYIANKATLRNGETTVLVQSSIDNNDGFLLPEFNVNLEISMN